MSEIEDIQSDIHTVQLGKLVGNLQSLEFMLRDFLSNIPEALP